VAGGWGWAWLMSRSVIQKRRKRIRGHRGLRPLVLCGAMLAPALLAGGLLVAEATGYEAAVRMAVADAGSDAESSGAGSNARSGTESSGTEFDVSSRGNPELRKRAGATPPVAAGLARSVAFGPRAVPPPPRPYPTYEGLMIPAVVDKHHSTADDAPVEAPPTVRNVVPRAPVKPPAPRVRRTPHRELAKAEETCPGEWRETWLWEVCKEHVRQEA
jgi:hypothetical protein